MSASSKKHPRAHHRPISEVVGSIRADVRLTDSEGFTKSFKGWGDVSAWMASPEFTSRSADITSVRFINHAAQASGAK